MQQWLLIYDQSEDSLCGLHEAPEKFEKSYKV